MNNTARNSRHSTPKVSPNMPHQQQEPPRKMMIKLKLGADALAAAAAAAAGNSNSSRAAQVSPPTTSTATALSPASPHDPTASGPGRVKIKLKSLTANQVTAATTVPENAINVATAASLQSPQSSPLKPHLPRDKDKPKPRASKAGVPKPGKITIPAAVVKQLRESGAGTPNIVHSPTTLTLKTPSIKFKTKIDGKPAALHRKRPVEPGLGYDSEASDREEDPTIEEQFILRMKPGEDCEYLRHLIETRQLDTNSDVWMKFKDPRRAVLHIRGTLYGATLVDLPCIVESSKTLDKKAIFKTADICQMLIVGDPIPHEEHHLSAPLTPNDITYPHGLTPPLQYVRKRRFRKRVSNSTIEAVESEVDRLLTDDQKALSSKYELLDPTDLLMKEENDIDYEVEITKGQTNGIRHHGGLGHRRGQDGGLFGTDDDEDADAEGESEYEIEGAGSGPVIAKIVTAVENPDADAEGEEDDADWNELQSAIMGGMTQMMELDAQSQPESGLYAGATATTTSSSSFPTTANPQPPPEATAPTQSSDEDEEDEEEEDEEEEINDAEDAEAAQEAAQENQKVKQDIADLESLISRKISDLNAPNLNPIIRTRIQAIVQSLQAELAVKRNLLEGAGAADIVYSSVV